MFILCFITTFSVLEPLDRGPVLGSNDVSFSLNYINLTSKFLVENLNLFIKNKFSTGTYFTSNKYSVSGQQSHDSSQSSFTLGSSTSAEKKICPMIPNGLVGRIQIDESLKTMEELERMHSNHNSYFNINGHFIPKHCTPHSKVAIIIPYRNRLEHLKVFLNTLENSIIIFL